MATLPAVPGVIRCQFKQDFGGDLDVLDRFYVQYTGTAPTSADMVTFCGVIGAAWATHFAPLAGSNVTLVETIGVDLSTATSAVGSAVFDTAGTRAGQTMAAGVAALVNFHVARRYRGGKPRVYLPFGTDSDLETPQTWNAGFVTALVDGWTAFISEVLLAPWSGGVLTGQANVSYYEGFTIEMHGTPPRARNVPTYRAVPLVDLIASTTASAAFSSQRRRNRPK